ncbi:hypothetical protein BJ170DRAFT_683159 [Xylariales sp. AK1849]|nr:hypothetical protein BJ170DRAFT_683159 [Xylariales sp. AK1849]
MGSTLTRDQKDILAMSKAQYMSYVGNNDSASRLQVTTAVFRVDIDSSSPTILLLKRKSTDTLSPCVFEVPTGIVDDEDFWISDSVARTASKQTSLRVQRVTGMLRENRWLDNVLDEESWADDDDDDDDDNEIETFISRQNVRLNWTVFVDSTEDVVVMSDDYEEYVWASRSALVMLNLKEDVRDLAKEALTWAARFIF